MTFATLPFRLQHLNSAPTACFLNGDWHAYDEQADYKVENHTKCVFKNFEHADKCGHGWLVGRTLDTNARAALQQSLVCVDHNRFLTEWDKKWPIISTACVALRIAACAASWHDLQMLRCNFCFNNNRQDFVLNQLYLNLRACGGQALLVATWILRLCIDRSLGRP